jgi:hypothetical protein
MIAIADERPIAIPTGTPRHRNRMRLINNARLTTDFLLELSDTKNYSLCLPDCGQDITHKRRRIDYPHWNMKGRAKLAQLDLSLYPLERGVDDKNSETKEQNISQNCNIMAELFGEYG